MLRAWNIAVMPKRRAVMALGVLGSLASTPPAHAAPDPSSARPAAPEPTKYSPWQSTRSRWYVSSASDAGIVFVRPQLGIGYGSPFWQFVGFETYALATNSFASAYLGYRASLPFLDIETGYRAQYPFDRRFLDRADRHGVGELGLGDGDRRSIYSVVELAATLTAPLLHGGAFAEFHPMYVRAPRDVHVYEEVLRAVMRPPFAARARLGYVYTFGPDGAYKLGALGELIVLPGRPSNVVRLGPVATIGFSKTLEGIFALTLPVKSPDDLGLYEGSYGFLGVRMRWARDL